MNESLNTALKYHQQGVIAKAEKIYQQILNKEPDNADVLHLMAILEAQRGNLKKAEEFITHAISIQANTPSFYNSSGNIAHKQGDLDKAIKCYQKALKLQPNYAVAHNSLGNIFLQQGKLTKAKEHYKTAISLAPNYADAYYNLALIFAKEKNQDTEIEYLYKTLSSEPQHVEAHHKIAEILHKKGELEKAISHYHQCLKLDPLNKDAFHNLGAIFMEQHNPEAALKYFLRLLQLEKSADTYYNLGVIYMYQNRDNDAVLHFKEAIKIAPDYFAAYNNLGSIYLKFADYTNALKYYHEALKLEPKNREIAYIIKALTQKDTPKEAPKEYIKNLFNQYAPYFDTHLTKILAYKVPELLYDILTTEIDVHGTILDLGCGTGLSGQKLRPLANKLIGIDLSATMISAAKNKNIYDELQALDIKEALTKYKNIDLIIAADTFVYIGDLEQIFAKCRKALKPDGHLAFTIESSSTYPYELQKNARFAHSKQYIINLTKEYNFKILCCNNIILRKQNNKPITGYLFLIKKYNQAVSNTICGNI